jgi:putative membrane protein
VVQLLLVAAVFGIVNSLIRPILTVLTCPLIVVTLGLFTLVINALMLMLTGALSERWGLGFTVGGFWAAFFGGLVVGLVSVLLSLLLPGRQKEG